VPSLTHTNQVMKGSVLEPSPKLKREWSAQDVRAKVLALRMVALQVTSPNPVCMGTVVFVCHPHVERL
jgi:hypothetical protein